ncbi:MAG: exo-alpha-sialidase [Aridibacter famidurans]|nr:exo-alpha-sialidase [Aridibacter famidurans]
MNLFSLGTRMLGLLIAAGLPAIYSASSAVSGSTETPEPRFEHIAFGEWQPFPDPEHGVDYSTLGVQSLPSGRTVVHYEKSRDGNTIGRFFRQSFKEGGSYSPEEKIGPVPGVSAGSADPGIYLLERGIAAVGFAGSNITLAYRTDQERSWGPAAQVNDELATVDGSVSFYQGQDGSIYCVWVDDRKGFPLVFFSSSPDGGRTWTPNKPVEFDFREGDQWNPQMVIGAGGRLLVFWEDWRDRKTLVDIRYAWSDDGGKHWVPGGKVNDDGAHVWQIDFTAVASGNDIYVAFSDFRDPGEEGDNDWNIYFASSANNGTSFGKNVRLNDVTAGIDKDPRLAVGSEGELFCFWRTGRNTVFGEAAVSYSPDGGRHWSPSTVIGGNRGSELSGISARPVDQGNVLVAWREIGYDSSNFVFRVVSAGNGRPEAPPQREQARTPEPLRAEKGSLLFADDFSEESAWDEEEGLWLNVNGAYMGTAPGKANYFVSFAPVREPESYILEGRFLLDPVAHYISSIYIRSGDSLKRQIAVTNQFRVGAWLSIKDEGDAAWQSPLGGTPVAERRFPFQRNEWYDFKLVVTPTQVDYYIEGRRLLGARLDEKTEPGSIGLGGYTSAPTYFDDIRIYSIRQ